VPQVAAEFIKACIDSLLGVPKTKNQALGSRQVWDRICKQFGTPDAAFGKTDGIPEGIAAYDLSNGYNWKSLPLADNVHEFGYWDPPYDRMYRPEGLEIWRVCRRLRSCTPLSTQPLGSPGADEKPWWR